MAAREIYAGDPSNDFVGGPFELYWGKHSVPIDDGMLSDGYFDPFMGTVHSKKSGAIVA